jgi:hypothetical protein
MAGLVERLNGASPTPRPPAAPAPPRSRRCGRINARVRENFAVRAPIDKAQAGLLGAVVSGAATGLSADLMAGGLTLGGGALLGAIVGALTMAGAAWGFNTSTDREPSDRAVRRSLPAHPAGRRRAALPGGGPLRPRPRQFRRRRGAGRSGRRSVVARREDELARCGRRCAVPDDAPRRFWQESCVPAATLRRWSGCTPERLYARCAARARRARRRRPDSARLYPGVQAPRSRAPLELVLGAHARTEHPVAAGRRLVIARLLSPTITEPI